MQAILFLAFVLLVYFLIRMILNVIIEAREKTSTASNLPQTLDSQLMVRCAHCGVHLPQCEAYFDGTHTYCSEGHMKAGPKFNTHDTPESNQAEPQETES